MRLCVFVDVCTDVFADVFERVLMCVYVFEDARVCAVWILCISLYIGSRLRTPCPRKLSGKM